MCKFFRVLVVVCFICIFAVSAFAQDTAYSVFGPRVVKVGQIAHFKLLNSEGYAVFAPHEDWPHGAVTVSPGSSVEFFYSGRNAHAVAVKFLKSGLYSIHFKESGTLLDVRVL